MRWVRIDILSALGQNRYSERVASEYLFWLRTVRVFVLATHGQMNTLAQRRELDRCATTVARPPRGVYIPIWNTI